MRTLYLLFILSVSLNLNAQNYGETAYPHSRGSKMSDALTIEQHTNTPGNVMVGYLDSSSFGAYNFVIDRTVPGGYINPLLGSFQKAYQIHANRGEECNFEKIPIFNCAGVSIIETNINSGHGPMLSEFAIAGSFSDGCFFSLLDASGNPMFSTSYKFPAKNIKKVTQPHIIECTAAPGEFIICGSFDFTMYVFRISSINGTILWSHLYPIVGEPRDMIPAAFGPNKENEFIIVGKTWLDSLNNEIDGFAMMLNQHDGSVIVFRRLNIYKFNYQWPDIGNQYFNVIKPVYQEYPSPFWSPNWVLPYGYVIGGYTEPFTNTTNGTSLYYRVDTAVAFQSIYVYTSDLDTNVAEVTDILVRKRNNPNTRYKHNLLIKTGKGTTIVQRDNVVQVQNPAEAFHYPSNPNTTREACRLGMVNDMNSPFGGMQLYGTLASGLTNQSTSNHLLKTYFNGKIACNSFTSLPAVTQAATMHFLDTIIPYGGLNHCPFFFLSVKSIDGFVNLCGPNDTVAGGDNSRQFYAQEQKTGLAMAYTKLFPNPSKGKTTYEYAIQQQSNVKFELHTILGQKIMELENGVQEAGTYSKEIDLNSMNLSTGVYFIKYEVNGEVGTLKLVYDPN